MNITPADDSLAETTCPSDGATRRKNSSGDSALERSESIRWQDQSSVIVRSYVVPDENAPLPRVPDKETCREEIAPLPRDIAAAVIQSPSSDSAAHSCESVSVPPPGLVTLTLSASEAQQDLTVYRRASGDGLPGDIPPDAIPALRSETVEVQSGSTGLNHVTVDVPPDSTARCCVTVEVPHESIAPPLPETVDSTGPHPGKVADILAASTGHHHERVDVPSGTAAHRLETVDVLPGSTAYCLETVDVLPGSTAHRHETVDLSPGSTAQCCETANVPPDFALHNSETGDGPPDPNAQRRKSIDFSAEKSVDCAYADIKTTSLEGRTAPDHMNVNHSAGGKSSTEDLCRNEGPALEHGSKLETRVEISGIVAEGCSERPCTKAEPSVVTCLADRNSDNEAQETSKGDLMKIICDRITSVSVALQPASDGQKTTEVAIKMTGDENLHNLSTEANVLALDNADSEKDRDKTVMAGLSLCDKITVQKEKEDGGKTPDAITIKGDGAGTTEEEEEEYEYSELSAADIEMAAWRISPSFLEPVFKSEHPAPPPVQRPKTEPVLMAEEAPPTPLPVLGLKSACLLVFLEAHAITDTQGWHYSQLGVFSFNF